MSAEEQTRRIDTYWARRAPHGKASNKGSDCLKISLEGTQQMQQGKRRCTHEIVHTTSNLLAGQPSTFPSLAACHHASISSLVM